MLTELQKQTITKFVEERVAKNDPYHQMQHVREVLEDALWLSETEKGNKDVIWLAAMLHDITKYQHGNHATIGAGLAKKYLCSMGFEETIVESVHDAIYWHNKEFKGGPIERCILWDADKYRNVTLNGFRTRVLPFFMQNNDPKTAFEKAVDDYHLFITRFRTETGRIEAKKHCEEVEQYIAKQRAENSF